jgi:hypothetical protein
MPRPVRPAVIPTPSATPAMWGRVARNPNRAPDVVRRITFGPGEKSPRKTKQIERIHRPRPQTVAHPIPRPSPVKRIGSAQQLRRVMAKPAFDPASFQPVQFRPQRGAGEFGHQVGGLDRGTPRSPRPRARQSGQRRSVVRLSRRAEAGCHAPAAPRAVAQLSRDRRAEPMPSRIGPASEPRPATGAARRPPSPQGSQACASGRAVHRLPSPPAPAEADPPPPAGRACRTPERAIAATAGAGSGAARSFRISAPIRSFASRSIPSASSARRPARRRPCPAPGPHTRREIGRNAGCAGNPPGSGHGACR